MDLGFNCITFATSINFSYLIASMGLQALWSLGLGCLDCYALILRRDLQQAFLMSLFVVGDWVNYLRHLLSMLYVTEPCLFLLPSSHQLMYHIIKLSTIFSRSMFNL